MNQPLTPDEVERLKGAYRERLTRPGEQGLGSLADRLSETYGELEEGERAGMTERLRRSTPSP
ncbi:hypothetical protein J5X84_14770 [Streptosporangiaceae bacterium NEAU-GS5]|nr:hypothetical protein [Streptosporangiaceae bacterium NEAU-GS5]